MGLTFVLDYQDCQAIVPAIVLAGVAIPEAVMIVGALLVAAGVTYVADSAIDRATEDFYSQCVPEIKQSIIDIASSAENGIASVSDSVWNYTRDWVQENYIHGSNTYETIYHIAEFDDGLYPYLISGTYTDEQAFYYKFDTITWQGDVYTIRQNLKNLTIQKNGVDVGTTVQMYSETSDYGLYLHQSTNPDADMKLRIAFKNYLDNYDISSGTSLSDTSTAIEGIEEACANPTVTVEYIGADVLTNPTWDFKDAETARREVGFPIPGTGTLEDLLDKTWEDVANPDTTIPEDPPTDTDWNYQDWTVPADVIKNKFPFSIPWDLKNSISALVATPEAPYWEIEFPDDIYVGGGEIVIDFEQFELWAKIVRWGVLISFNIFLILATRKIIGAS